MTKEKEEAYKYDKEQLLTAKKYAHRRDALNALLSDGESYTIEEVDALLNKFEKGKV